MTIPQAGDPLRIPAAIYQQILRNNEWIEQLRNSQSPDLTRLARSSGIVRVENGSGSALDQCEVLGIDTVFPTPTANETVFKAGPTYHGHTPARPDHCGKFVVTLEPIADGKIGFACASGICVAKISVPAGVTTPQFADVKDSDCTALLASLRDGGARILYRSGTWAVIRLDGAAALDVPIELKTDLALGGSATAYHLDDDGVRTTVEETVYDILGFYEGDGASGSGAGDGDKGWCTRMGDGTLKLVALSCDPPG